MLLTKNSIEIKNVIKVDSPNSINHIRGPHGEVIWDRPTQRPNWLQVYVNNIDNTSSGGTGNIDYEITYSKSEGYAGERVTATVKIIISLQVSKRYEAHWVANTVYVQAIPPVFENLESPYGPLSMPDYNGNAVDYQEIVLEQSFEGFIDGYYFDGELLTDGLVIEITNVTNDAY